MTKLMQVGRWRLTTRSVKSDRVTGPRPKYLIMHYCEPSVNQVPNYGADGKPLKQSYSWVVGLDGDKSLCIGCKRQPPAELIGFVSMLEWER
jgi:hypothetical protein